MLHFSRLGKQAGKASIAQRRPPSRLPRQGAWLHAHAALPAFRDFALVLIEADDPSLRRSIAALSAPLPITQQADHR